MTDGTPSDGKPRVLPFRQRPRGNPPPRPATPGDDLSSFARSPEPADEYRQRMMVNAAALLFVVALIGAAIWLADSISDMRRNQDCVLSGRRGCTQVEYDRTAR